MRAIDSTRSAARRPNLQSQPLRLPHCAGCICCGLRDSRLLGFGLKPLQRKTLRETQGNRATKLAKVCVVCTAWASVLRKGTCSLSKSGVGTHFPPWTRAALRAETSARSSSQIRPVNQDADDGVDLHVARLGWTSFGLGVKCQKTWSQVPKVRFPIHVPATVFSRDNARSLQVPRVRFLTHATAGLLSRDIASALHVAVQPPHSPTNHRQTHRTRSSNYHGVEFSAHHILVPKSRTRRRPPRFHLTRCPVVCLQHLTTRA